ncbi:TetR/AcrR family transcriptional regulator [Rhodococcus sp. NPDC057297]|uniref:TetR/AcrR family transcriptional regulator n=1 Tax=Rhodococcus sp. NPDC057297 TaxID=3346090 RepID=UPI003643AFBA
MSVQKASIYPEVSSPTGGEESFRARALDEFSRQFDPTLRDGMSPAKRRVLEAFLNLCVRHGMESVSMRTLAKELDIKAPSIYTHFPGGRDEIITESLRWHFLQFSSGLVDAVLETGDASEFWDAMVRFHFIRQVELPESNLWDLIVATDRTAHVLPTELSERVNYWVELYESLYIAAAHDLGVENAGRRVKMVMTLLEGATRWFDLDTSADSVETGAEQALLISRQILSSPVT